MKTVIEMAREAGAIHIHKRPKEFAVVGNEAIERFAELVRADAIADEREQAEERVTDLFADMEAPYLPDIAAAIRARGEASIRSTT